MHISNVWFPAYFKMLNTNDSMGKDRYIISFSFLIFTQIVVLNSTFNQIVFTKL